MTTRIQGIWGVRAATLAVWILAAGSAGFWGLRLVAGDMGVSVPPPALALAPVDQLAVGRVLGAAPVAAPQAASLASRFMLQGVVAGVVGGGAALIAVDGKPARAYRVGAVVENGLLLQSVAPRQATLAATLDGPAVVKLDMPPLRNQ